MLRLARRRRMTRAFEPDPVPRPMLDALLDTARRAPSAGNTQALAFLVLEGDDTARYWEVTLPEDRRRGFPWPGLLQAPALVIPFVDAAAYAERYSADDKVHTGLGASVEAWPTPYWRIDGGMAAMTMLLGAEELGLGALFFGLFDHEDEVKVAFGVPAGLRALGTVALGFAAPDQRASSSATRPRPPLSDIVHRGRWSSG